MTQIAETPRDEQAKVESWRLHVLMEADLHHAVDLIRQGCAPETATEILI
jgi:hypothetical protein